MYCTLPGHLLPLQPLEPLLFGSWAWISRLRAATPAPSPDPGRVRLVGMDLLRQQYAHWVNRDIWLKVPWRISAVLGPVETVEPRLELHPTRRFGRDDGVSGVVVAKDPVAPHLQKDTPILSNKPSYCRTSTLTAARRLVRSSCNWVRVPGHPRCRHKPGGGWSVLEDAEHVTGELQRRVLQDWPVIPQLGLLDHVHVEGHDLHQPVLRGAA